jgi:preprotein translocase subunit SecA
MMDGIKEESVGSLFNLQVEVQQDPIVAEEDGATLTAAAPPALGGAPANGQAQNGQAQNGQAQRGQRNQGQRGGGQRPGDQSGPSGRGQDRRGGRHAGPSSDAPEDGVPAGLVAPGLARPQRTGQLSYTAPAEDASGTAEKHTGSATGDADFSKTPRNAPCPCGSGRKFKQCHGDPRNR